MKTVEAIDGRVVITDDPVCVNPGQMFQVEVSAEPEDFIVKEDLICPVTKQHCDDECCPMGATCNLAHTLDPNSKFRGYNWTPIGAAHCVDHRRDHKNCAIARIENHVAGFIDCPECGCQHTPVPTKCPYKIEKDAAYALHACGQALSTEMIGRVLQELDGIRGNRGETHRYVSASAQRLAYLRAGEALRDTSLYETADDGAQWRTDKGIPADMLLIEFPDVFGVITSLAVQESLADGN